jgi:rod shape-determining protein MreC
VTVIVLVVLSLSIISLDLNGRTHSLTSGIKSAASDVYDPMRQGVVDIISPIGSFLAGAFNYGSLQSENEKLQATLGQLRMQQAERAYENQQLRKITALQHLSFAQSLPYVTAQTTQEYSSNFTATIVIDKGRSDGVVVGYPVVGAGGLVGQVIFATAHTATVQLINDGQSKVAASFGSSQQYSAIVDGQGPTNDMTADLVAPGTPVRKGQTMYTSGLEAAAYPPGIPVATVSAFHTASGASQESITVEPSADLNQLAYVDVLQWVPPT